jgi:hypothetical protein
MTGPHRQPAGFLDRLADGLAARGRGVVRGVERHARLLGDPESMVAALIMTIWSVLAGFESGTVGVLIILAIGWFLHVTAVETGSHVTLWLATAGLLILIVVASITTLDDLPPVLLATSGATALTHNELVRLNYARRRRAEVDPEVFRTSAVALTLAGVLGVVGVALADAAGGTGDRTWLWMPAATGALMAIGFGLSLLPTRRAPEASRERWKPGERLPPPPSVRPDEPSTGDPAIHRLPGGR